MIKDDEIPKIIEETDDYINIQMKPKFEPELYKGFIKLRVRKVITEMDIPIERAIDFLNENPKHGIIEDYDGKPYTLEELKNAKSFGSSTRTESDNLTSSGGEVSEDSYRELFELAGDNSE